MAQLGRQSIKLGPQAINSLRGAVGFQYPQFAPRVSGGIQTELIEQPWFARHKVVEVNSVAHFPAKSITVAFDEQALCGVLTANLAVFNAIVAADPPPRIADLDDALVYGNIADHWTSESGLGELVVASLDEVPWAEDLDPIEQMLIDDLAEQVGQLIEPLRIVRRENSFVIEKWVVAAAQLIRREVEIAPSGRVDRRDQLIDSELPCPKGEIWGMVGGRLVPIG